jgi:tetratricopeptide (TPR) repeat protein
VAAVLGLALAGTAFATPHVPGNDADVLAELPAGTAHVGAPARQLARARLDVALPLAHFYISRSRATGDLRFLGYAEATLAPWLNQTPVSPAVLVLHATILQSRHAFDASLAELDRALAARPDDVQAWLTRATVLRVLGRYDEALASCEHLADAADPAITTLCRESLRGLTGHLEAAYAALVSLPLQALPDPARVWRYSELGEMAERLGNDAAAEHWFLNGLALAADDFYIRAAYSDLLLRQGRNPEALHLLNDYRSMEPMLLRVAIAEKLQGDSNGPQTRALLSNAFTVEEERGDAVHRREQARFLLDVEQRPAAALAAAQQNWRVQREPDDVLILLRSAYAAQQPQAAAPALEFLRDRKLEDVRLNSYRGTGL